MVKDVVWTLSAQRQLEEAYEYILISSYQNAEKVKADILFSTRKLSSHAEAHPLDKYKNNNDGSFRSYEIHRHRLAYRVTEKHIVILRVRHTNREPKSY